MFRRLLTIAFALLALPASAGTTVRTFNVANWTVETFNDANGKFNLCAARKRYDNGVWLIFGISHDFHWSLGFAYGGATFQQGKDLDVEFAIDDMAPVTVKAEVHAHVVELVLAEKADLFARFRRGKLLRTTALNRELDFNLTGTSQLLPALLNCVQSHGSAITASANLRNVEPNGARMADSANVEGEALAFAANLLSAAGIQGFRILLPSEHPEIKGHARWIQGTTFGTVNIYPKLGAAQVPDVWAYLIGIETKACRGTFFSGAIPNDKQSGLWRMFTTCQTDEKLITTYYIAAPRRAGGLYLLSTTSLGSEKPAKDADAQLRSATFRINSPSATSNVQ